MLTGRLRSGEGWRAGTVGVESGSKLMTPPAPDRAILVCFVFDSCKRSFLIFSDNIEGSSLPTSRAFELLADVELD